MARTFCLILALILSGCRAAPVANDRLVWMKWNDAGTDQWTHEAERKWGTRPVVVSCHGSIDNGRWTLVPDDSRLPRLDAESVAWTLHEVFPGRRVLYISCNPGGVTLDVPGLCYAKKNIWTTPDSGAKRPTTQRCTGTLADFTINP